MTSSSDEDIRVVVGIDFGTTYSGFSFAHISNPNEIITQNFWKAREGWFKAPTVIRYDDSFETIESWGYPALAKKPNKDSLQASSKPVELFKLHLLESELEDERPFLPDGLDYKKVIRDYLENLGMDIKKTIETHWSGSVDFHDQVKIVLTVPAEFDDSAVEIMRECMINAKIVKEDTRNLRFASEPEAAAINSISDLTEGDVFMVVDCGGGTVDLTVREIKDNALNEITERTGGTCGSCYIDKEFVKFLGSKIGDPVIDLLREKHYSSLQYIVQEFCLKTKIPFTGREEEEFEPFELDLVDYKPIKQFVMDRREEEREKFEKLEKNEWLIEAKFEEIKGMFDTVIDKILTLIRRQLEEVKEREREREGGERRCSKILLVGGFSESKYLQDRIREATKTLCEEKGTLVPDIIVPKNPVISISRGAVKLGLDERIVRQRILTRTYGFCVVRKWQTTDPLANKLPNGYIKVFEKIAMRDELVSFDHTKTKELRPYSLSQKKMKLDMYVSTSSDVKYIKDPRVKLFRKWEIKLPETNYELNEEVTILFTLKFDPVGMRATAKNKNTGDECHFSFNYFHGRW